MKSFFFYLFCLLSLSVVMSAGVNSFSVLEHNQSDVSVHAKKATLQTQPVSQSAYQISVPDHTTRTIVATSPTENRYTYTPDEQQFLSSYNALLSYSRWLTAKPSLSTKPIHTVSIIKDRFRLHGKYQLIEHRKIYYS
jgi:hypothetical protein